MQTLTAQPAMRRSSPPSSRRERLRRMLIGSALLHLALLLAVLLYAPPKLDFGTPSEAPSVDMVFQTPEQTKADQPAPGTKQQHTVSRVDLIPFVRSLVHPPPSPPPSSSPST